MVLTYTRLENHPDGTVGVVAIINGNWERLELVFSPLLSAADPSFQAFYKALARTATLPTTSGSVLEWSASASKMFPRAGTAASASPIIDLSGAKKTVITLAADPTFSTTNRADGWHTVAVVKAGGSTRALTFPAWVFVGSATPTSLASGKTALLELWAGGVNESDVVARWTVQP